MTTRFPVGSAIRLYDSSVVSVGRGRPARRSRRSRKQAFTLIELMVVVAIITLLVSIIIPSLAVSRENVRSVLCRTNLTEVSKAILMYANAHGGVLPYEDRVNATDPLPADIYQVRQHYVCWYDAIDKYFQTGAKSNSLKDRLDNPDPKIDAKTLTLKLCPTVARDAPNSSESYRMNSKLCETNWLSPYYMKPPFRKLDTLKSPLTTVMLFDGDTGGTVLSFKGRWRQMTDDVDYRHNTKTNIVYAGGNIENIHKKVLAKKSVGNSPVIWQPADVGPWDPNPLTE